MTTKHTLRIERLESTNIESEVPEAQIIREDDQQNGGASHNGDRARDGGNKMAQIEDSSFVQVYSTVKEETTFQKGGLKLQKVSVNENVSVNYQHMFKTHVLPGKTVVTQKEKDLAQKIANPFYSEVHGEVVQGPQLIRIPIREEKKNGENREEEEEEKKPRSRIPMKKRFQQMAEKVRERRKSEDRREPEIPKTQPRRSSIPKLRKTKTVQNNKDNHEKLNTNSDKPAEASTAAPRETNIVTINRLSELINAETLPAAEEFDKMFDEIIHSNDNIPVVDSADKIEDAEQLEHSFEEIVHDYEENKGQPIEIAPGVRSRIPLVKQKSLPEETLVKKLHRRSSLKDIPLEEDTKTEEENKEEEQACVKDLRMRYDVIMRGKKEKIFKAAPNVPNNVVHQDRVPDTDRSTNKKESKEQVQVTKPDFSEDNHLVSKPDSKIVKEVRVEKLKIVDNINEMPNSSILVRQITKKPLEEDVLPVPKRENPEMSAENNPKTYGKNPSLIENTLVEENTKCTEESSINDKAKIVPTVIQEPSEVINIDSNADKQALNDFPSDMPKKKSILTKIAVFNKDHNLKDGSNIIRTDIINYFNTGEDKSKVHQETNKTPPNTPQIQELRVAPAFVQHDNLDPPKNNKYNELSPVAEVNKNGGEGSFSHDNESLEKYNENVNNIDREPKEINIVQEDEVIYNPIKKNMDTLNYEDSYKLNSAKRQVIRATSEDFVDSNQNNDDLLDNMKVVEASNLNIAPEESNEQEIEKVLKGKVSKIISRIDSVDDSIEPPKKEIDIPIKKSVLSRIAIFEQKPQPTAPRARPTPQHRTPGNISKPKIIDEVLKAPPPRNAAPNHDENKETINNDNEIKGQGNNIEDFTQKHKIYRQESEIRKQAVILVDETIQHVSRIVDAEPMIVDISKPDISKDHDKPNDNLASETNEEHIEPNDLHSDDTTATTNEKYKVTEREVKNKDDIGKEKYVPREKELWRPKAAENINIEDRLKRLQSRNEDGGMKKAKSVAELDLGNAVVGKVHKMVVRMNSMENLEVENLEKKSNINVKERPRKKSVSEKIALFEKKLVAATADVGTTATTTSGPLSTTTTTASPPKMTEEEKNRREEMYRQRIEDLKNAKTKYGTVTNMTYMTLQNDVKMPIIALGTALMDPVLIPHVISAAIELGYRCYDTAYIYGNQKEVGEAIRAKIDDGTVKREELFIINKLWSTFHRRDLVDGACRASLEAMGLDYFDLYLVHNPMSFKEGGDPLPKIANVLQYSSSDYMDAWYGMEALPTKGLARSIGVSNFNSEQMARVVEKGRIKPAINQVECHPYLTQQRLTQFCADRSVPLMCFGTLGSKGTPVELRGSGACVLDDPLVTVMAAGLGMTPAQLLVRYQIESGHALVVKASTAAHLWDNLQALHLHLSPTEVEALNALNRNKRTHVFKGMGDTHRNYPFKISF